MVHDFCIIGGGIVGLSTALELTRRHPGASIVVLEKESALARHQTGHNSGVIHAGIYYAPGSLKADLCKRGAAATKLFCEEHAIAFDVCGKLVVATSAVETARMEALHARATQNGLSVQRVDAAQLKELEPHIAGTGALLVDSTGIVDYKEICRVMALLIEAAGGQIALGVKVDAISEGREEVEIRSATRAWRAKKMIACAGLQSDRIARMAGIAIYHQIVPFRGEYYRLRPELNQIVKHLIYPVPDPELPFLGVHLTRMIDGSVTVGPNAVLGFAREGYAKLSADFTDMAELAAFPGFWKVMGKHFQSGVAEMKDSLWKRGYLRQCQKYCPELSVDDLLPCEAGIRAQAVMRDGTLVHDFLFAESARTLHVCNAPSPAATSAIPIGQMIADRLMAHAA